MAYKIVRNHIVEQLEIEDNGNTVTLNVDLSVDKIIGDYNKAQYSIAIANRAAHEAQNEGDIQKAEQMMGEAVLNLFEVIFGERQTQMIVDIYQNRALEMLADIAPFISDVIQPRIAEAQQRIAERYRQVSKGPKRIK